MESLQYWRCFKFPMHLLGRRQNTQQRMTKADKGLLMSLQKYGILLAFKSMQRFDKICPQFTKRHKSV